MVCALFVFVNVYVHIYIVVFRKIEHIRLSVFVFKFRMSVYVQYMYVYMAKQNLLANMYILVYMSLGDFHLGPCDICNVHVAVCSLGSCDSLIIVYMYMYIGYTFMYIFLSGMQQ